MTEPSNPLSEAIALMTVVVAERDRPDFPGRLAWLIESSIQSSETGVSSLIASLVVLCMHLLRIIDAETGATALETLRRSAN